ncbi:MAG: hypothetical protein JW880_08725 [Candidatus Thermoplasmatota archaeon]|nr:hypothetical protein [Candidatus Thermoplasmatota archaeon]
MSSDSKMKKSVIPSDRRRIIEAEASWIASMLLFFATVYVTVKMDILWVVFGIAAISLYILPIVSMRNPFRALPWEMALLLAAPLLLHISEGSRTLMEEIGWWNDLTSIAFAFSLTTIGFMLTVELQMYTRVRMNRPFAILFVVLFTLGISGFWHIGQWVDQKLYGVELLTSNGAAMMGLFWTLVGGVFMGFAYDAYIRTMPKGRRERLGFIYLWEVTGRKKRT